MKMANLFLRPKSLLFPHLCPRIESFSPHCDACQKSRSQLILSIPLALDWQAQLINGHEYLLLGKEGKKLPMQIRYNIRCLSSGKTSYPHAALSSTSSPLNYLSLQDKSYTFSLSHVSAFLRSPSLTLFRFLTA